MISFKSSITKLNIRNSNPKKVNILRILIYAHVFSTATPTAGEGLVLLEYFL